MIDRAEMKGIAIDPDNATATAEGGVIWGELNLAAAEHGLAVTGGLISTTGIAGYTLGGGLGWLMGKYGLAGDNLLAVELVRADGEVLEVDAASHADLFWALRGGGGIRRRDVVHLPHSPSPHDPGRTDRSPARCRTRHAALLPQSCSSTSTAL